MKKIGTVVPGGGLLAATLALGAVTEQTTRAAEIVKEYGDKAMKVDPYRPNRRQRRAQAAAKRAQAAKKRAANKEKQ